MAYDYSFKLLLILGLRKRNVYSRIISSVLFSLLNKPVYNNCFVTVLTSTVSEVSSPSECNHDKFEVCFAKVRDSVYHLNEEGILLTEEDEDSICR